jgi:2,4-dienoyl-CoA reductase (NADPH2)
LADPAIIAKSRGGPAEKINYCVACNQACIDQSLRDRRVSCMVNPRAGRELQWPEDRSSSTRGLFAVIGGGPAGLEAARVLAALGHQVVLYEAQAVLGGQLRLAARVPGKHMFARTIEYFEEQLKRLGVELRLGRRIEASAVAELADTYDGVVVASGVVPRSIALPGANGASVCAYPEALAESTGEDGPVAIIGAGGIGLDVAHLLSTQGRAVTLMCRGPTVGGFVGRSTRWALLRGLRERGVNILTRVAYESIEPEGVRFRDQDGVPQFITVDRTVIAAGQERSDELSEGLRRSSVRFRVVGGARDTHQVDAVRAFREGVEAAHDLVMAGAPKAPLGPATDVRRGTR